MLRPLPTVAGWEALYPLSYRRMERRAGFEPATSRLTDEVTDIFTTDRDWVGGERSMLYGPCGHRVGDEVTDIFTTAGPVLRTGLDRTEACASAMSRHAGEQAKSVSVIQLPPFPKEGREPWRVRDPC